MVPRDGTRRTRALTPSPMGWGSAPGESPAVDLTLTVKPPSVKLLVESIFITTTNAWYGIELRHLVAFRAVVSTGSFSAAAQDLGYTQSGVSQQVAALERMLGAALFSRPGGP